MPGKPFAGRPVSRPPRGGSPSLHHEAMAIHAAAVSLQGIQKSFRSPEGPVHAVRGVDVTIEPGEVVALLGPNGAGKSTTIDVLLGLTKADAGSVALLGRPPAAAIQEGLIGAMLQIGSLPRDLTVREIVTVIASLYREPVVVDGPTTEIKAMVGLRTIRATLPGADLAALARLPGVSSSDARGEAIVLRCTDSDTAVRALLQAYPAARDLEITGAGFEEAFMELTRGEGEEAAA